METNNYFLSDALAEGGYMVSPQITAMKIKTYYAGDVDASLGDKIRIDNHECTVLAFISDRELLDQGIYAMPEIMVVRRDDGADLSYDLQSIKEGDHEVFPCE